MSDFDRRAKAEALLANPIFKEVFETVDEAIHKAWAETPTHKKDQLHELRLMLAALKNVRKSVEAVAREGKAELHRSKQPTFLGEIRESWNKPRRAN